LAGKKTTFLYLSEQDMIKAGVLDGKKCVDSIDQMFKVLGEGDYLLGGANESEHGIRLFFPLEKRFPAMPVMGPDRRFMSLVCYLGGEFKVCANKWYGSNIENPRKGLPRSVLVVVLNDVETGEPLAFMSANLLSAMRTGAVPAVAAKYLATADASTVSIVGAGVISRATLTCIKAAVPALAKAKVYDLYPEKAQAFCMQMSAELKLDCIVTASMEESVRDADIVISATAGGVKPKLSPEWVKPNAVVAAQSALDIPDSFYTSSRIVFDDLKMHQAWKEEFERFPADEAPKRMGFFAQGIFRLLEEGKIKQADLVNLGDIATGKRPGRQRADERFVLISGGLPTEDAAWGFSLYQNARKLGIGQELVLWEEPHWM
jgi:ornithine cyclodeaminase